MDFNGKSVLIVGFGLEGASAADFFIGKSAYVTIYDAKKETEFDAEKISSYKQRGSQFQFGAEVAEGEFDLCVHSPGVPLHAAVLVEARSRGIVITTPTQIFFDACGGRTIGVTGTKGKGTTASLIHAILNEAGIHSVLGGNIGTPMLSLLPEITDDTIAVLELSSFQLMDLKSSPHVAVVLMVTTDHMDFHSDEAEYVAAKANITKFQTSKDILVVNCDYTNSCAIADSSVARQFRVSAQGHVVDGCYATDAVIVWSVEDREEIVAPLSDVQLPGRHNLENVCAAIAAVKPFGIGNEHIVRALRSFMGLEHRLEFVRDVDGVRYYNDSFATNPSSTIAAVRAFEAPEVLILGGSSKGSDFSELATVIAQCSENIRAIIGIGAEWPTIKTELEKAGVSNILYIEGCATMSEVVTAAHGAAKTGDIVLMSPACASFGMFPNYKVRGKQFKECVTQLS